LEGDWISGDITNLVRLAKATCPVLLLSLGTITGCPKDHQSGTPAGTAPPIVPQISANALIVLHWYAPIITQYQNYQKNLPLFEKGNEIAGSCDVDRTCCSLEISARTSLTIFSTLNVFPIVARCDWTI
jgi:hypothetical protein